MQTLAISVRPMEGVRVVSDEVAIPAIHPEGSNLAGPVSAEATVEFLIEPISRAKRAEDRAFRLQDGPPGGQLPGPQTAGFTKAGEPIPISPLNLLPVAPGELPKDINSQSTREAMPLDWTTAIPLSSEKVGSTQGHEMLDESDKEALINADGAAPLTMRIKYGQSIAIVPVDSKSILCGLRPLQELHEIDWYPEASLHDRLRDLEDIGCRYSL